MSKPTAPLLIHVPSLFSIVEPGVYRCASPTAAQVPFLATLGLRTIVSLTPEHPIKPLLQLAYTANISFIHLGVTLWRPRSDWRPVRDELVKAALEMILDTRTHPILILDPLGIHQTGCVVGALRAMQGWNFASTLVEYRAHSGPTKHRYSDEQYIEASVLAVLLPSSSRLCQLLFDPDLINLPPAQYLPKWYVPSTGGRNDDDDENDADAKVDYADDADDVDDVGDVGDVGGVDGEDQGDNHGPDGAGDQAGTVEMGLGQRGSERKSGKGETADREVDGVVSGQSVAEPTVDWSDGRYPDGPMTGVG